MAGASGLGTPTAGVILVIRHFLTMGSVLPETCFPAAVVSFHAFSDNVSGGDRLFYGHYDKTNHAVMAILKDLTGGKFKDGAVARG